MGYSYSLTYLLIPRESQAPKRPMVVSEQRVNDHGLMGNVI